MTILSNFIKRSYPLILICSLSQANAQIIHTAAGNGTAGYSGDGGQATAAQLDIPVDVSFDKFGNLYFVDRLYPRIRKVNVAGIISTVAGNGTQSFAGDGGTALNAEFNNPECVIVDAIGNIYIGDHDNGRVRKVDTLGIITTVAGYAYSSYSGDGGPAISAGGLCPTGLAFDKQGNLYISNDCNSRVRKVDLSGMISTIAGNGTAGFSGDGGTATSAEIKFPQRITFDAIGNLYIADYGNNRIRMVDTFGIITTVVGNGGAGFSGDGGQATVAGLPHPTGIVFDGLSNLYISDWLDHIREVNTSGIISTIAGNGTPGYSGDGGPAIAAQFYGPLGIAMDASGNLGIADEINNRIRIICAIGLLRNSQSINSNSLCDNYSIKEQENLKQVYVYPNPTSDQLYIETNTTDKLTVDLYNVNGIHVFSASVLDKSNINIAALDNGAYTLTIKTADRVINKKLIVLR